MIEPTTAQELLNNIVPYLIVGGVKGLASTLWTKLKSVFAKTENETIITNFEKDPTDKTLRHKVESVLQVELEKNKELTTELVNLLKQVQATEEHKNVVKQTGDNNIAVTGKISSSTISINQK
jgi:hypothetical protein